MFMFCYFYDDDNDDDDLPNVLTLKIVYQGLQVECLGINGVKCHLLSVGTVFLDDIDALETKTPDSAAARLTEGGSHKNFYSGNKL